MRIATALVVALLALPSLCLADCAWQLTDEPGDEAHPRYSPDGTRIAFVAISGGAHGIHTMPAGGGTPSPLVSGIDLGGVGVAAFNWSPDGSEIAYAAKVDGQFEIWKVTVPGGVTTRLTDRPSEWDYWPTWSPDGSQIVFASSAPNWAGLTIWTIPADGGSAMEIGSGHGTHPCWSTDGSLIAFVSQRSGTGDIWTMPAGGEPPATQITSGGAEDGGPDWSPDGSRLVYHTNAAGNWNIAMVGADGGTPELVTDNPASDFGADWSPDGSRVVFASNRGGSWDVWELEVFVSPVAESSWGAIKALYH